MLVRISQRAHSLAQSACNTATDGDGEHKFHLYISNQYLLRKPAYSMDSTGDPLLALRHAIKSKTTITYLTHSEPAPTLLAATHLSLSPRITLPKSSPTRYTKPGVSNPSSAADVYTLEAVYLAWLLRDAPGAEYMRQARESGLTVGFVSVTERKSVVEWLEGKIADLERIRPLVCGKCVARCPLCDLALVDGFVFVFE